MTKSTGLASATAFLLLPVNSQIERSAYAGNGVTSLPPLLHAAAVIVPLTYAVSLLGGIWKGDPWSAHFGDVAALAVVFLVCTALSAKVFRWE